jgi:hypothetical protein
MVKLFFSLSLSHFDFRDVRVTFVLKISILVQKFDQQFLIFPSLL